MRITLTKQSRQELLINLDKAKRFNQTKFLIRIQAVMIFIDEFYDKEKISEMVNSCLKSIYNWIYRYMTYGIKGLKSKKPCGRKSNLSNYKKKKLQILLSKPPEENGYDSGIWTCAMIKDLINKNFNVEYSVGYINQLLLQLKFSYKVVESISHKADEEEQKNWLEEKFPEIITKSLREGSSILFQDESTFRQWSRTSKSWGKKGEKLIAKVNMSSNYQKVFGAIDFHNGNFYYQIGEQINADGFISFMEKLISIYCKKIILIIDNGPAHTNYKVSRFLALNKEHIELYRLPKYSPKLNPIEKLWKKIKKDFMHNRFFETKKKFKDKLEEGLISYSSNHQKVLSIMKKYHLLYNDVKNLFLSKRKNFEILRTSLA